MLSPIDHVMVIAYLLGIVVLGLYFKRFIHSSKDYFLAGKMLPFWAIGMSIVVSDIGAIDFVGVAGQGYRYGIAVANFDWLGSVPAMLLAAFIFVPYFWKAGVYTIPEYLGRRYNDSVRTVASVTWIIFFAFNLGVVFWASAVLLKALLGWEIGFSIMLTAVVVGVYTFFGGLAAVVLTDVVQMIIMFVGGAALVVLGLIRVGGWSGLVEKVTAMGPEYQDHFDLILPADTTTPFPWTGILFGLTFVMANAYMIGNQTIIQRCFSAKSVWHAKASMIWAAMLKMAIPVLILFPGLMAVVLEPGLEDGDEAVPAMIRNILPPGLRGLLFVAFLAGLMSTIDSVLNSTATIWTRDIYQKFILPRESDRHYLIVGRFTTLVLLTLGVITAPITDRFEGVYVAVQTFLSFLQGPIFAVLLLGIFTKRITQWGGLCGLAGGIGVSALLHTFKEHLFTIEDPFLYVSWWSFVAGVILAVTASVFTRPHSVDRLRGLVYGLDKSPVAGRDPC